MVDRTITGDFVANPVTAWAGTEIVPAVKDGMNAAGTLGSVQAYLATMKQALNEAPPVSVASAATLPVAGAASNTVNVTGTTAITALDTAPAGAVRRLVFDGALTLTHNATTLILPGAANITTAAGDVASFVSLGGGAWRCWQYMRASGASVVTTGSGFVNFTETLFTAAPNNSAHALRLQAVTTTATSTLVLSTTGNGAITRHVPDGAATGGDLRGAGAVDLQVFRTSSAQVAAGQGSLVAGELSRAGGRSAVAMGYSCTAEGAQAIALGAFVNVTGTEAAQLGGSTNTIDGNNAAGLAGFRLSARGIAGVVIFGATAGTVGRRQGELISLAAETSDATSKGMTSDASLSPGSTNQLKLSDNASAVYRISVVARQGSNGDTKAWTVIAAVRRGSGVGTTAIVGTPSITVEAADAGAAAWSVSVGVDTASGVGALRVTVTGEASKTIHWSATAVGAYVGT